MCSSNRVAAWPAFSFLPFFFLCFFFAFYSKDGSDQYRDAAARPALGNL